MRNGDAYKIRTLHETGSSDEDIINRFRNEYSADEVKSFIPKKARKKRTAKVAKEVPASDTED